MKSRIISILKFVFLLAIAFVLLAVAFKGISLENVIQEIRHANFSWLLISVVLSTAAFISRAYRWNLLINSVGYYPKLNKTTYSLLVGYFANLAFPRIGEVTRCGSLSKAEKVPFNILLGTVIVERTIDFISLILCLLLTAVVESDRLGSFLTDTIVNPAIDKFSSMMSMQTLIIIGLLLVSLVIFIIWFVRKKFTKESKLANLVTGLISGLRSIGKLKRPGAFLFHSIFIWVLYYFSTYFCLFALPSTSGLGLGAGLFVLVVGGFGMTAPVQGGIGAFHLLVSQGLILYGLTLQDGLAFATLIHASQTILVILFGSISLFLLFLARKKERVVEL